MHYKHSKLRYEQLLQLMIRPEALQSSLLKEDSRLLMSSPAAQGSPPRSPLLSEEVFQMRHNNTVPSTK